MIVFQQKIFETHIFMLYKEVVKSLHFFASARLNLQNFHFFLKISLFKRSKMEKLLCLLCQELHPSDKAKFLVELRKHINYKTFCCGVCDFKGFSSIEVAEHYNDKHSDADINIRRVSSCLRKELK